MMKRNITMTLLLAVSSSLYAADQAGLPAVFAPGEVAQELEPVVPISKMTAQKIQLTEASPAEVARLKEFLQVFPGGGFQGVDFDRAPKGHLVMEMKSLLNEMDPRPDCNYSERTFYVNQFIQGAFVIVDSNFEFSWLLDGDKLSRIVSNNFLAGYKSWISLYQGAPDDENDAPMVRATVLATFWDVLDQPGARLSEALQGGRITKHLVFPWQQNYPNEYKGEYECDLEEEDS